MARRDGQVRGEERRRSRSTPNTRSFTLYTSGTTGKPKGVVHTTGGYMVYVYLTMKYVFDLKDEDTYWCTADIGWVTGHSYILYGPLLNGATSLMYEGAPNHPNPDRFWDIVERHKVNIFYTAPTAIRAFHRWGEQWPAAHDLSSLRLLGTVGEPINPEAWMWYHRVIGGGRCPIVDTWWQTETGGIMITPLPGATPTKPGTATLPFFGIVAEVVDRSGAAVPPNSGGYLVIREPWPAMLRTIWGDDERYKRQYWSEIEGCLFLRRRVPQGLRRLLLDHGARRRRHQRRGAPARNHGGRERARLAPDGRRIGGGRAARTS